MIYTSDKIKKKNNRKRKISKILKVVFFPIIAILLILILYTGYIRVIKSEKDVSIFGFRQYMVMTGSMEPEYKKGDLIVVKSKNKEQINVGDVINYTSENNSDTITHRIIEKHEEDGKTLYTTKGDSNNSNDPDPVNFDQVKGVVVFRVSKLGMIITNILTGTGIAIIFALVFISYVISTRKEEKRIAREDIRKAYNKPKYE